MQLRIAIFLQLFVVTSACLSQDAIVRKVVQSHRELSDTVREADGYSLQFEQGIGDSKRYRKKLVNVRLDSYLFESRRQPETRFFINTVYSISPQYCFKLSSKGSAEWNIVKYVLSENDDLSMKRLGFQANYRRPTRMPENTRYTPTIASIGQTRFDFLREFEGGKLTVIDANEGDEEITLKLRRRIDYGHTTKGVNLAGKTSNVIVSFKNAGYKIPLSIVEKIGQLRFECKAEHSEIDKTSFSTREQCSEIGPGAGEVQSTIDIEFRVSPPPKKEFLLSSYGFPEPSELRSNRSSLLPIVLGVLLLAAAAFLTIRQRQASVS